MVVKEGYVAVCPRLYWPADVAPVPAVATMTTAEVCRLRSGGQHQREPAVGIGPPQLLGEPGRLELRAEAGPAELGGDLGGHLLAPGVLRCHAQRRQLSGHPAAGP